MPTPEEYAALKAKLAVTGQAAGQAVGEAAGRAVSGIGASYNPMTTINALPDAAQRETIGRYAGPALRGPALGLAFGHGDAPPEMQALSKHAQGALARNDMGPEQIAPMATPDAQVTASPTLDPRYEQLAKATGGVGAGGPSLRSIYQDARKRQVGDYDTDKNLESQLGMDKSARIEAVGMLEEQAAARKMRDAEIQQEEDAKASQRHQAFLDKNVAMADDIAKQQIDPNRLQKSRGPLGAISDGIGRVLGGLSTIGGGKNVYHERLDKEIDRDIAAQQSAIENKKAGLGARNSIFGQMLSETGDRRQAAMATRNLMYEAVKQKLAADAERLGIPEVRTNAEKAVAEISHKQDALQTDIAKENMVLQQQQAAAAAAARAAAEKQQWDRTMQLSELALKQDNLKIEAAKASGETMKGDNAAVSEATKRLADDDIMKYRPVVNSLASKAAGPGDIEGLGKIDMLRAKLSNPSANWMAGAPGAALLGKLVGPGDQDRVTQQQFDQLRLAYKNKVTGSGGSDTEAATIDKAFMGAGSMAEKKEAIRIASEDIKRREGLATAGLNDSQKALLTQRLAREGQVEMPGSVTRKK